jgi:uncharacterized protein involved in type VI secretion and phage assembly
MMLDQETERFLVEAARYMHRRYFGKYQGIVKEVGEGENLGKIRAWVPEIYGEEVTNLSPWAIPCVPFAGPDHGFVVLPEVDDGVWIEFMEGDISCPIWTGCWFVNDELVEPSSPQVRTLVTTAGHKLILDDEQNQVRILHSGGAEMTMTENDITLKIGSAQIVLSKNGSVNINNGAFEVK